MGPGAIIGIAVVGLLLLMGGGKGNGAKPKFRDDPLDPNLPGTGPIDPGPNNEGPKPSIKGPGGTIGWGGGQYGPGPIPADFDWSGNLVYISEDCRTIAEPLKFLPIPGSQVILRWWMPLGGGPSAQADLLSALGFITETYNPVTKGTMTVTGTAWGSIARDVARQARDGAPFNSVEVATEVFRQVLEINEAECGNIADPETWPKALQDWWNSLSDRIEHALVDAEFGEGWYGWNELWDVGE